MDLNKDGVVQFTEFVVAASKKLLLLTQDNVNATFAWLDADRDGRITTKDLATIFNIPHSELANTELGKSYHEIQLKAK
jgi:Ca2+-binding EF-hand superfamily protein